MIFIKFQSEESFMKWREVLEAKCLRINFDKTKEIISKVGNVVL